MATEIKNAMLQELRQKVADLCVYGRYKIGSTWHTTSIDSVEIQDNGAVHVGFYFYKASAADTSASQFQVCKADGTVLAERVEEVPFPDGYTPFARFKFGVSIGETEQ